MELLALIILIIFSLIGLVSIFFTDFGTLMIFIGTLLYAILTTFSVLDAKILIILFTLYLCGEVLEYVLVIIGAKKFGASNYAAIGAIIGGILGALAGLSFLGVGVIPSTLLGVFLGAFLVEFCLQRDLIKSLKAGVGSLIGRVGSILLKCIIAIIMLAIVILKVTSH